MNIPLALLGLISLEGGFSSLTSVLTHLLIKDFLPFPSLNSEFVEELRLEYGRRERSAESLAKKTKDLMMVSGIVAAVIMGAYGALHNNAELQIDIWLNMLVMTGVMMVITMVGCILLNRVEFQRAVFLGSKLTETLKPGFDVSDSWMNATKEAYYRAIVDEYRQCLIDAESKIARKAMFLGWCIGIFIVGLSLFPIFLIIIS